MLRLKAYMKHLMSLDDRKFSCDPAMKFHAFNVLQKRDVALHTTLQVVQKPNFQSTSDQLDSITTESLDQTIQALADKTPVTDANIKKLMSCLSSAGSHVKGSPYEKSANRREIFGLMVEFGTPALWITISPAASHSPVS